MNHFVRMSLSVFGDTLCRLCFLFFFFFFLSNGCIVDAQMFLMCSFINVELHILQNHFKFQRFFFRKRTFQTAKNYLKIHIFKQKKATLIQFNELKKFWYEFPVILFYYHENLTLKISNTIMFIKVL